MLVASLTMLAAAGCASASSGGRPDLPRVGAPAGSAVRIRITPPREISAVRRDGTRVVVPSVRMLDGRLLDVRGDSIYLRLSVAHGVMRDADFAPPGPLVVVALDSTARVRVINRDPRTTERRLLIAMGAAYSVAGLLSLVLIVLFVEHE